MNCDLCQSPIPDEEKHYTINTTKESVKGDVCTMYQYFNVITLCNICASKQLGIVISGDRVLKEVDKPENKVDCCPNRAAYVQLTTLN